jgi:tRNA(Ile)-lysidine synthase
MITPDQAISSEEFEQLVQGIGAPIGPFAVAVSGGADSMALCRLANSWAKRFGAKLTALTVDHVRRRSEPSC